MNQFAQLNKQNISGVWRDGKSEKVLTDTNPYNGSKIAEFRLGNLGDLDEAYRSAASAQKIWQEVNPFEKRAILERAITWIEQHEADITDIIIEELGGTALKAFFEIGIVKKTLRKLRTIPLQRKVESFLPPWMARKTGSTGFRSEWSASSVPSISPFS